MKKSGLVKILAIIGGVVTALSAAIGGIALFFFNVAYRRKAPKLQIQLNGTEDEETKKQKPDEVRHEQLLEETKKWIEENGACDFYVTSEDGLRLHARMIFAENAKKTAILVHGFRAYCETDFAGIMQYYHSLGYNVFLLDDRGHAGSEGKYLGFGWLDRRDIVKWVKELITVLGDDMEFVLHGVSMGAAAVMCTSGEADLPVQVKGIIEDCGFSSQQKQFLHSFPANLKAVGGLFVGAAGVISKIVNGYYIAEASSVNQLYKNHRPMLFIHGCADDFVPFDMVYENYSATQGPRMLYCVPGAEHALAYTHDPEKYQEKMKEFLDSVM